MARIVTAAAVVFGTVLPASSAWAQGANGWQGEWGAVVGANKSSMPGSTASVAPGAAAGATQGAATSPTADAARTVGRRLTIHDCKGSVCRFSLEVYAGNENGGTAGDAPLTVLSAGDATATLPGGTADGTCVLRFHRQAGARPAIVVAAAGRSCTSYYATGAAATMSGSYPLRSAQVYAARDVDACYTDDSTARHALCTDARLAALEEQWTDLADQYPLVPHTADSVDYAEVERADGAILHGCDQAPDVSKCLASRYGADIATMQARKNSYLSGTIERGDPATGGRLAAQIAGSYQHRFRNGDVSGDSYESTDTLTIRAVGAASIHFDVALAFYNGHSCSLAGGALYRRDGSFVFDDTPDHSVGPDEPVCRLAITPTATGVTFRDITGGCKDNYCGERGSWNGASFLFRERGAKR